MEYSTADLYWEDSKSSWYKTSHDKRQYYFHNDTISCWQSSTKHWSRTFFDAKDKLQACIWKKIDERFVRDGVKMTHYKDEWKGRMEYPGITNENYGNQASAYESSLGKGTRRRFTLLLDDDVYDEIVANASLQNKRRNTYINEIMRTICESNDVLQTQEA